MKKLMPLLIVFMLLTACQQVPTDGSPAAPAQTSVSPSAVATPMTAELAQQALNDYQLPGPTSSAERATWDGGLDSQKSTIDNWVRFWIERNMFWPQELELAMNDPDLLNSIHARVITGADGSSVVCVETTSLDLPDCYIPPTDPATGQFYPDVPDTLPGDTFIAWRLADRPDGLTPTSYRGRPALMDASGKLIKVLGADSKFKDFEPAKFSENYPAAWSESYTGDVEGVSVEIDIGLTSRVINRSTEPIKEIHLASDIPDVLAGDFMHMCWLRYTLNMGHPEVTYDQYLELVKQGQGKVEFVTHDGAQRGDSEPRVTMIDPREGVSIVFEEDQLPTSMNSLYSVYFAESNGRLLMVVELSGSWVKKMKQMDATSNPEMILVYEVYSAIHASLVIFGLAENRCLMFDNYTRTCGEEFSPPRDVWTPYDGLLRESQKYFHSQREPVFEIKQ